MTTDVNDDQHPSTNAALRDLIVLERHTIAATNTAALFDGDAEYALGLVVNETTDETAVVSFDGGGNNATIVNGTAYGNTAGSGSNNNVYHDGSDYVVENQTGAEADYTLVGLAEV